MITRDRIEELGRLWEKVMARHPEADRETVWLILSDLELPPEERLRRALSLGKYAISRRLPH